MTDHFKSRHNAVFFIAEIGGNHEGDFAYARKLAELAMESGADAIKFQLYTGDTLVNPIESPDRNKHFKKFELTRNEYIELANQCNTGSQKFMASVWNKTMLEWIDPYIEIHKVGSGDLTCYSIISRLVHTKKPIILSTGLATLDETKETVDFIFSLDPEYIEQKKLALLHCNAMYPTPDIDANVDAMVTLKETFGLPVGYSDHTLGPQAVEVAVSQGAQIIEKHFTDSRAGKTFRDHKVSLTRTEVQQLLEKLKKIKDLKGDGIKKPTASETKENHHITFRRSIYAAVTIRKGTPFSEDNIVCLRPAHGLSAKEYFNLLGKTAGRDISALHPITESDLS